ncbi:MAG: membrane protein insertase YidC [Flavobacteriales bacterium]
MDRNSVIGLVLIAVILVVFSVMNAPSEEERLRAAQAQDSIARAEAAIAKKEIITVEQDSAATTATLSAANDSTTVTEVTGDSTTLALSDSILKAEENLRLANRYSIFAAAAQGEKTYHVLENDRLRLTFSNKGGQIVSAELKNYETYYDFTDKASNIPLKLFDEDSSSMGISFQVNGIQMSTLDLFASTSAPEVQTTENADSISLVYRFGTNDPEKFIELVYSLNKGTFVMGMQVQVIGLGKEDVPNTLELNWSSKLLSTERLVENERMLSSVFYKYTDAGRTYLSETSSDKADLEKPTSWIAFKQSYFSVVLMSDKGISDDGSTVAVNQLTSAKYIKEYVADLNIGSENSEKVNVPLKFYFGPNDIKELSQFNNGMEDIVNLGWGIFRWTNKYLVIPIFNVLDSMNWNYGIIILILTLIVKIIILPLTYKNYKSSAKMRVLKPEIDEITKKMGSDDPMAKQQATMALYRSSGVNPMAGCFPMLLQMPVLIAVFRFFPSAVQLRQTGFLWADDLSGYDSILDFGFNIPLYGDHISLFTLLMAVSTILITRMNSGQMDTGMPGMKFMMYFFPIMMIFFFNNMSSGLSYYYFVSNVLSLAIMWGIKKWFIDEKKILAQIQANRKNPKTQKKSAFMQRLEEAQRMQQQKKKK